MKNSKKKKKLISKSMGDNQELSWRIKSFEITIEYGRSSIKSLFLINSGAILALLAFFGQIWGKDNYAQIVSKASPNVIYFLAGLIFSILAGMTSYFSQAHFTKQKDMWGTLPDGLRLFMRF